MLQVPALAMQLLVARSLLLSSGTSEDTGECSSRSARQRGSLLEAMESSAHRGSKPVHRPHAGRKQQPQAP